MNPRAQRSARTPGSSRGAKFGRLGVELVAMVINSININAVLRASTPGRAFSLIEVVIVIVILGVIAAIAIPRMSNAADNARTNAMQGNLSVLNKAADLYAVEHEGLTLAHDPGGTVNLTARKLVERMTTKTHKDGTVDLAGAFGPYLLEIPVNPYNRSMKVRIDGVIEGAGLAGWRFDSSKGVFMPDDLEGVELVNTGKGRLNASAATVAAQIQAGGESAQLIDGGQLGR